MKKIFFAVLIVILLISCVSPPELSTRKDPQLPAVRQAKTIALVPVIVDHQLNRRRLFKLPLVSEYSSITVAGVPNEVAIITPSPDLLKNSGVTDTDLSILAGQMWRRMLEGTLTYNTLVYKEGKRAFVSNSDLGGVDYVQAGLKVTQLTNAPFRGVINKNYLDRQAGKADLILAPVLHIYGETGRITDKESPHRRATSFKPEPDSYFVYIDVHFSWTLYDGKTGEKIITSGEFTPEYNRQPKPEEGFSVLPAVMRQEVRELVNSKYLLSLLPGPMKKSLAAPAQGFTEHFILE